jgi:hypothetical protein
MWAVGSAKPQAVGAFQKPLFKKSLSKTTIVPRRGSKKGTGTSLRSEPVPLLADHDPAVGAESAEEPGAGERALAVGA